MAPTLELYTYFRSSCSARIRMAAHLKGLTLSYSYIHLLKADHKSAAYSSINPCQTVPTLVVTESDGTRLVIRQSVAILEYLEERFPDSPRLLPTNLVAKTKVRELVNVIACDVQPVTNMKILQKVKGFGVEAAEWQREFMRPGLLAYEEMLRECAGRYSVGDELTLADICLVPQVDGALRFGVDLGQMPNLKRVYEEAVKVEGVRMGQWMWQEDTPEELRGK